MSIELATLLRRDHRDLDRALADLCRPHVDVSDEFCDALDGARLGLLAHHEAQDRVLSAALHAVSPGSPLHEVVNRSNTEHLALERAMSTLILTAPHTTPWRHHVDQLRALLAEHMQREEGELYPALEAALAPEVRRLLAAGYATERLRQLAQLQPAALAIPSRPQPAYAAAL